MGRVAEKTDAGLDPEEDPHPELKPGNAPSDSGNRSHVGKIARVQLRDVWKNEASGFTAWLERNVDVINEVTGLSLINVNREQAVGDFNVDLTAEESGSDRIAIIENQLEPSDHDHLGKLLTYVSGVDRAKVAIWIVKRPRSEHIKAITWLNESLQGAAEFYLLQVEAIKIGDSHPAPLLTKIVGPDESTRQVGASKKELSERAQLRRKFWTGLLTRAKQETSLHSARSPTTENWISGGSGLSGLEFTYVIYPHGGRAELYIDRGSAQDNDRIFRYLIAERTEIERAVGSSLEWEPLESRRACRVSRRVEQGGYEDPEHGWPDAQKALVAAMVSLEKGFRPYIEKVRKLS